ncbi:glycoside hydrolase family 3 N-terminal domain-containing protein [Ereboglobus luteus]|uniref:Glycosyl hydrolase n=1 Tax=Ereboglobus luteus TaxID=1796921 RepID=A0A2U8DZ62_9BACT|nr:glycoside hydrolase family 3 N-terminal domain-containing protein [Ereboglobus luteus]AWI07871.1 glycosyl hydrolase [Ereboglobus luteus]
MTPTTFRNLALPAFLAAFLIAPAVCSAAKDAGIFVNAKPATHTSPDIYRDGWIDLNKNGVKDAYEDPALPHERRIEDLVARMTLEEKTAQMVTWYGYPRVAKDELPTPAWDTAFWKDGIGNIDEHMNGNTGWTNSNPTPKHALPWSLHARAINEVQRWFIENTRLGIPVDFTNEGIRGLLHSKATAFPHEISVGATWNTSLVREMGRVVGREARALGYTNVYSPVLDVARDPRWGRIVESFSEDPFLTGELGLQQVLGIQEQNVVSTLKHFAIYSIPKGGRDGHARTDPQVTWREVQTIFMPPFKRAIKDGGALGVMSSYNDYDGIPVQASKLFLTEILRGEYGFRGYVVSDSGAVEFIHDKHRTAVTPADAIRQSVEAGLNIRTNFTPPEAYAEPLRQLVRDGKLSMETIDSRVRDILRVKYWLGLFDRPYVAAPDAAEKIVRASAHMAVARQAEREGIVLLKNENNVLPLDAKKLKRVLVAGPLADDKHGWWSRYGAQLLDFVTPLDGIRAKLSNANPAVEVRHAKGVDVKDKNFPESDVYKDAPDAEVRAGIDAAVAAAKDVDIIIAALGETDDLCRESASRISLNLPGYQEELLKALHATGKPVILVLSNGRPLSVNWAAKHIPAIVEMWLPGEEGGGAIADVLFGDYNPAGRLPVTFPKSAGQIQMNFPAHPGSQDRDYGQVSGVLWPFGHGLSYTTFTYSNLKITPAEQGPQGRVEVSCEVANSGSRAGDEVVQLYVRDDYSSVVTFEKVLRGFERVNLAPGETKTIHFTLKPEHLALYDKLHQWTVEPGHFTVMVGASSEDIRLRGGFDIIDGVSARERPANVKESVDPR